MQMMKYHNNLYELPRLIQIIPIFYSHSHTTYLSICNGMTWKSFIFESVLVVFEIIPTTNIFSRFLSLVTEMDDMFLEYNANTIYVLNTTYRYGVSEIFWLAETVYTTVNSYVHNAYGS